MNCKYSLFLLLLFLSAPLLNAQINYASKADHLIGCWPVSGKSAVKSNQPEFGCVGDDRIVFQENFARPTLPDGWATRSADKSHTWYVNSFPIDDERSFQSVDPDDRGSAIVDYVLNHDFDEWLITKPIAYPGDTLTALFYLGLDPDFTFAGVDVLFHLSIDDGISWIPLWKGSESVIDVTQQFFSWWKITVPIPAVAKNKTMKLAWQHVGKNGDQVLLDGFKLIAPAFSDRITIYEGDSLQFYANLSDQKSLYWLFPGGIPAASAARRPMVRYEREGIYPVTLSLSSEGGTSVKDNYIEVLAQKPEALFEVPAGVYHTVSGSYAVPPRQEFKLYDRSTCYPRVWNWSLPNSNIVQSDEQHPVLYYPKEGAFDIALQVENSAGTASCFLKEGIKVALEEHVWNILPDDTVGGFELFGGYHGYFPGSNTRTYLRYAEYFAKPLRKALLSEAVLFFVANSTNNPDAEIRVSVHQVGADGYPGVELASAAKKIKEVLLPTGTTLRATHFTFPEPMWMEYDYFIVIDGIPNGENDCVVFSAAYPREDKGTAFICHKNQDPYIGQAEERERWDRTEDIELLRKSTSYAVLSKLTYEENGTDLVTQTELAETVFEGEIIGSRMLFKLYRPIAALRVYSVTGVLLHETGGMRPGDYQVDDLCSTRFYIVSLQTREGVQVFKLVNRLNK